MFSNHSCLTPVQYRNLIKDLIRHSGLDPALYGVHGMHTSCTSDLLHMGVSVETIKKLGRWKSTSVYVYLRI